MINQRRCSSLLLLLVVLSFSSTIDAFFPNGGMASSTFGGRRSSKVRMNATSDEKPFAVIVQAEIEPDRMAEFLDMIKNNAEQSRKEPGCLRFDVLRSQDAENKFIFYELYKNQAAVDFHKTQPHYESWAKFKESGGTITSVTSKADGEFTGV